jgi:hypothetical protein
MMIMPRRWGALALVVVLGHVAPARPLHAQSAPVTRVVTDDIDRFWSVYDQVVQLTDSAAQVALITERYIAPGTPGLAAMIAARRYTAEQYVNAIRSYPKFWQSIRANTLRAPEVAAQINVGAERLRKLYPALRPATVYFVIGVFRSNGTTLGDRVLIGAELAMADSTAVMSELPPRYQNLVTYAATNPIRTLVPLTVHELVHTQQGEHPYRLLHRSVNEGIAEYVSVIATGVPSTSPAIAYGAAHTDRIRQRFSEQLLSEAAIDDWLYNDTNNEFGTRDLGYYVGYAIAERFVARSRSRESAIKALIDLNYADTAALARVVDVSGFFRAPLRQLMVRYDSLRPTVVRIRELQPGAALATGEQRLTIEFSAAMDTTGRGFEFGPLGEAHALFAKQWLGFSPDGRSATIGVAPEEPSRRYQLMLSERFRDRDGRALKPFLVDVTTSAK